MSATGVLQASKALSAAGTTFSTPVDFGPVNASSVGVIVDVTAIAGTTPTLTLSVQWSNDGTAWADADPADAFSAIGAVNRLARNFAAKGRQLRLKEVLAGTTPTATYRASYSYNTN